MQEQGISLDEVDQEGNSAVHVASQHGYLGCIQVHSLLLTVRKGSLKKQNRSIGGKEERTTRRSNSGKEGILFIRKMPVLNQLLYYTVGVTNRTVRTLWFPFFGIGLNFTSVLKRPRVREARSWNPLGLQQTRLSLDWPWFQPTASSSLTLVTQHILQKKKSHVLCACDS